MLDDKYQLLLKRYNEHIRLKNLFIKSYNSLPKKGRRKELRLFDKRRPIGVNSQNVTTYCCQSCFYKEFIYESLKFYEQTTSDYTLSDDMPF